MHASCSRKHGPPRSGLEFSSHCSLKEQTTAQRVVYSILSMCTWQADTQINVQGTVDGSYRAGAELMWWLEVVLVEPVAWTSSGPKATPGPLMTSMRSAGHIRTDWTQTQAILARLRPPQCLRDATWNLPPSLRNIGVRNCLTYGCDTHVTREGSHVSIEQHRTH